MFLKTIRLTNFRCHENLLVDFSTADEANPIRKTTFLVGENGTGKTALLQAIALITAGSAALRAIPGMPDNYIQAKKRFCKIAATIVDEKSEEQELSLRLERGKPVTGVITKARVSLAPLDAELRLYGQSFFTCGFGSDRRSEAGVSGKGKANSSTARYAAISTLFDVSAPLLGLDEIAAGVRDSGGSSGVNALRDALNTFLPLELRCKGFARSESQFETPDGVLPFSLLGNGYRQTIAWISNLVYHLTRASGDYKNPLAVRGLLLIDGIDLHLHPAWQRQIHSFLAQGLPGMQVIATMYSPLTAQQAGRDELYALWRDEQAKVNLVPFIGEPSGMLLHQLLMSPMFGLATDESVKVEAEKSVARERALSSRKPIKSAALTAARITASDTSVPENLSVNTRGNSSTEPADIALLKQINAALKSAPQKSKDTDV